MAAHLTRGSILIASVDGSDDGPVLLDQRKHRVGARERELADAIHMRLDVLHGFPRQRATRPLGQCDVKELVEAPEARVVVSPCGVFLHAE